MPNGVVVRAGDGTPVAGVVVSDGLAVVRTDAEGAFSLPERDDAEFVFVTVPSEHRALAPGWFASVRDGRATDPLRFELTPREGGATNGCTFVQVTDLHVSVDQGARLRPMIEAGVESPPGIAPTGEVSATELREDLELMLTRVTPDFIAATGDLADYGQPEELEAYRDAITGLSVPVASVPGNHDHLSVLSNESIAEFFSTWKQEDTPDLGPGEAFQRTVFGGDWRRPKSGRAPWRDTIGPLYYSFDWGGVHFVAYDGEGLRRYGDDYPQDEWLTNDLAAVAGQTPVVVLTHFPETRDFYRARFSGVRLVASVSGHWHATRLWSDGDARHWTSSTLGFGGIDYTPRGYRVVEVDGAGARSRWETVEAPSRGAHVVGAAASMHGVAIATEAPDASGSVSAIDGWDAALMSAARGGIAADHDTVFAVDTGATLHAYDARTGEQRWSRVLGDPSVRFALAAPCVVGERVYVASAMSVQALGAQAGTEIWRCDLSPDDWAASWSGAAADADTVVIGAVNDHLHLAALEASTGAVRWKHAGRDIAGVSATPALIGDIVVAARAPGWLAAYALADGTLRWQVPLDDAWPVATAAAAGLAFVRSATGTVTAHDIESGDLRWTCALGPGERAARPYARGRGGARVPLLVFGPNLWTGDGTDIVAIELRSGDVTSRTDARGEVATVVGDGAHVVGVTVDAKIVRVAR